MNSTTKTASSCGIVFLPTSQVHPQKIQPSLTPNYPKPNYSYHSSRIMFPKVEPTFQHFLCVFHGTMDAQRRISCICHKPVHRLSHGRPMKNLSMLDLLDKLDAKYIWSNYLGCWTHREDPHILVLIASLNTFQNQFSSL